MLAAILLSLIVGQAPLKGDKWQAFDVPGEPRALEVWSPSVFSVAAGTVDLYIETQSNGGSREINSDGGVNAADGVGAFLSPANCFMTVTQPGDIVSRDNCRPRANIIPPDPVETPGPVRRVKHTASGRGYAAARLAEGQYLMLTADAGALGGTPWATLQRGTGQSTDVLSVVETDGGVPHALFGVAAEPSTQLIWFTGDREQARLRLPGGAPRAADLIAGAGPYPAALVSNANGFFRGQLSPSGTSFQPVTVQLPPDAEGFEIFSVDVNTGKGSLHGEGFGLAVGTTSDPVTGGALVVLGAVPADSAADAGTVWRPHRAFVGANLPPDPNGRIEVACVDSTYCAISLVRPAGAADIVTFTNEYPPVIDAGTPSLVLDEVGGTAGFLSSAYDLDGDAVRLSLDTSNVQGLLDMSTTTSVDLNPGGGLDLLDVRLTAREVCQNERRVLGIFASDGLATHDVDAGVSVTIRNVRGPQAPGVMPLEDSTSASGPPLVFTASHGSGTCATVGYQWAVTEPGQPVLATDDSGTATFTPPDVLCQPTPRRYAYTVAGLDQGGMPSLPTTFTVNVRPWGRPLAPFEAGAVRPFVSGPDAGVDVGPGPEALHACTGTPGLPPVETVWRLGSPGAEVPAGFTVKNEAGAAVSWDSTVVSPSLRVEAAACTRASLSLVARNRLTVDGSVQEGPEAPVQVVATPPVEDFATAALNLSAAPTEDGQVAVTLGTSLLCPGEYALQAQLSLRNADGAPVADARVAVPGSWSPSLPADVCAAAEYVIDGQLFSGDTAGTTAQTRVSVPARAAALGPLEGRTLVARCGEGATGTLTQTIPPNACRAVDLSWSQVGGPALVEGTLSGEQVTVATRDVGLEELVGQTLRLSVTANAGDANTATTVHEVPITTEPFVDVRHETESPTGSEKGLVGVVVRLRNTSECRVGGLRHVERVDGLEWVPGSVKVDGQPVVEQPVEGGFAVDGVTLEASATGTLTYVARPRLLSSPRFGGEVLLNSVLVSGTVPTESASGCGCSGGGSGAAAFGLLALARLLRRRRPATRETPR